MPEAQNVSCNVFLYFSGIMEFNPSFVIGMVPAFAIVMVALDDGAILIIIPVLLL